jgi:hypothetical protein
VSQPPAKQAHAKPVSQTPATTQINTTKQANEAEKSKSGNHVHTPKQVNTDTNPQKKASAKAQNYTNAKHKQKQKQRKGLSKQYMKQVEEQQRQLDEGIVVTKTLLGTCSVVEPGGNTRPYYSVEHQATHMPVTVSSYEVDVGAVAVPAVRRVLELLPVGFGCKGGVARQLLKLGPARLAPDHALVAAEVKSESTAESDVDLVVIAADSGSPRRHAAAADGGSPRSTRDSVLGAWAAQCNGRLRLPILPTEEPANVEISALGDVPKAQMAAGCRDMMFFDPADVEVVTPSELCRE